MNVNFSDKKHKSKFVPVKFQAVGKLNETTPATSEVHSERAYEEPKQLAFAPKFCVWHKSFIAACKTCQSANEIVEKEKGDEAQETAEKSKHRYFVSNYFVEKIFDNIMTEISIFSSKLEDEMQITQEKVNSLLNIREEELPLFGNKVKRLDSKVNHLMSMHQTKHEDDKNFIKKQLMWKILTKNTQESVKKK